MAQSLENERQQRGLPFVTLTEADCLATGRDIDLHDKLIIVDPKNLSPEYRSADHQLQICLGGFGASPNSRGNAVYCKDLYSGEESRFERYNILGVANPERLPEWAKAKITEHNKAKEQAVQAPSEKKPSLLGRLDEAKVQAAAHNAGRTDIPRGKSHNGMEVD